MQTAPTDSPRGRPAGQQSIRLRVGGLVGAVGVLHLAGWGTLLVLVGPRYPVMMGLGVLAYTLGLRHAFDADHISAIDNTTRKLLQQGDKPLAVGLFFSLGHSSVVFLLTLGLAGTAKLVAANLDAWRTAGSIIGTSISGIFLYLIALINLVILVDIVRIFRLMRQGGYDEAQLEDRLMARGFMMKFLGPIFRLVSRSWHLYPVGFLFGLGFDTASEVGFLAISAGAASQGIPLYAIVALPVLFAAGMSLLDTADGAFMAQAYDWAFARPVRKVYYNLTMTGLSVLVALFVGTVELLSVVTQKLAFKGGVWDLVGALDFSAMGAIIVAMFVVVWALALFIWKTQRIEERWGRIGSG